MPTTFIFIIIGIAMLLALLAWVPLEWFVKKEPTRSIPFNTATQDDYYVGITLAIEKIHDERDLTYCIKAIKDYQDRFGDTQSGRMDVSQLIMKYEEKETAFVNFTKVQTCLS